jgi:protocatechuate 3,4-dioxygenase beta subunit
MMKSLRLNHFRPAHLHFIVSTPGFEKLTSQVFTSDCPPLRDDAVFGVKENLFADFKTVEDPTQASELGLTSPFRSVEWNFQLSKSAA